MYSTKADIETYLSIDQLAKLTSESGDGVDDKVINGAIADADSEIDGYCVSQYPSSVPFVTVPTLIKTLSIKIAIHNLFSKRIMSFGGEIPKSYSDMYDNCVNTLKQIAGGKIKIPGLNQNDITTGKSGGYVKDIKNIFGGDNW
jgi:phage gp36-like protein